MVLAGWMVYVAVYGPGWLVYVAVYGPGWLDGVCAVYGPGWLDGVCDCLWSWLAGWCMWLSMVLAGWMVYVAVYGPGWMVYDCVFDILSFQCLALLMTHRVFKRSLDVLCNEQSTRIIFNVLEGNYALCLLGMDRNWWSLLK